MRTVIALTLAGALAVGAGARTLCAQTTTGSERSTELPVALTVGGTMAFAPETDVAAIGLTATATVRLSPLVGLGLALRTWWGAAGNERCSISASVCFVGEETEVIAGILQATISAPSARWLFARMGLGLALVREQEVEAGYDFFRERRSWPLTVLGGVGLDLELAPHVYLTPSLEATTTFVSDRAISATPTLEILFGVGLTVR